MSEVYFHVDMPKYQRALKKGIDAGIIAVTEQAASDSQKYVKYDSGTLHDSMRIEYKKGVGSISWNTPYAKRQYYTGTPIDHRQNRAKPHLMWAHYAAQHHGKDWKKIFEKAFARGMMGLSE